jgi:Right handed beta helix region
VELSVAPSLLLIENARNVSLNGIRFEKPRGDGIVVRASSNVLFEHVEVRNTGNRALVIIDSTATGIRDSLIENNGEGGVLITGGDRSTLIPSRNFIENCTIRRFSRLVKTMAFAAELHGVGHRVAGNTISDAPHSAILFSGNDHLIENNEIFNVVSETSDAGAIYVGRDFTAHGNVIRSNLIRDIHPYAQNKEVKGIYIDDQASGMAIRNNIFARVHQPVFIGGGRDNVVEGNLFYRSSPVLHLDARGVEGQKMLTNDPAGTLLKQLNAVPYKGALYTSRFPNLSRILEDDYGMPKYNEFRNNTIIDSRGPSVAERARAGISISGNRLLDESDFVINMAPLQRRYREDFKLKKKRSAHENFD